VLDPLYSLVARGIVTFHNGLAPIFGESSFLSYALAIVLIVMLVRLCIVPLFVRSVKAQRTMQMLQPHIKEIREKYKNDRAQMNAKIMELQKEHGNPLLGCLPLVLQIPLFISLFHVFRVIRPEADGHGSYIFKAANGLTQNEVASIANAKLGGVSLAAAFTNSGHELAFLGANGIAVKVTCVVLIIIMSLTTFMTQKQIMARNGPADPQQQMIQRVLLYASPLFLAVFGFNFPIAVLLYWLTTNLWSMGQQHFIIKRMPPLKIGKNGAPAAAAASSGGLTSLIKGKQPEPPAPTGPTRLTQVRQTPGRDGRPGDGDTEPVPPPSTNGSGSPSTGSGGTSAGAGATNGSSAPGGGGRSVKPAKATSRPANRPGAKNRGGKGSRRGGRR
jgi:YidC/Oxa1 family membrane protein insertase